MTETDWRLTTEEKKRILLNNIYGVDIDPQAVEVTKLSLLLKVLEGEKSERIGKQMTITGERVLPSLHNNIKCGNSLVGPDIYNDVQVTLDDEETIFRINAFAWDRAFPATMQAGGFDAVIGNPPYVRIQAMKEWAPVEVEYYKDAFDSAKKGNYDIYVVFVEKGMQLLKESGLLGYILPHKFFNAKYGQPLRSVIAQNRYLQQIIHFGHQQVFEKATTYTCLLFLNKGGCKALRFEKVDDLDNWRLTGLSESQEVLAEDVTEDAWNFVVGNGTDLFEKLKSMPVTLERVTDRIFQGLKTGADKIFIVDEIASQNGLIKIYSPEKDAEYWVEPDLFHPLVKGGDSKPYCLEKTTRRILFPYQQQGNSKLQLIPDSKFKEIYPELIPILSRS